MICLFLRFYLHIMFSCMAYLFLGFFMRNLMKNMVLFQKLGAKLLISIHLLQDPFPFYFYVHHIGMFSCFRFLFGYILCSFFIIPILSSFFGTRAFNDSSCYVGDDIVLGYPPVYPWIALVVGICSFFYIMKFTNALMAISALTFIVQLIVVLPHIANKIFPFEIRTKKGCLYFIILIIVFYLVLMYLALGNGLLNLPNVSLTPEQIIRKIIHFGSAMILAYLFYRQAKKMNKKSK